MENLLRIYGVYVTTYRINGTGTLVTSKDQTAGKDDTVHKHTVFFFIVHLLVNIDLSF